MVGQGILIGIIVGVFVAGFGVGYAVLQSTVAPSPMMTPQQMTNDPQMVNQWHQQMMQNPQAMNQWMNTMVNDPQSMNAWTNAMMQNPQAMSSWNQHMMQNPNTMNQWMNTMMSNPQMMNSIMNNPQFQQIWMAPWLNNSTNWNHMMDSGWMDQNMGYGMLDSDMVDLDDMGSGMMGGRMMMGNTVTQESKVLEIIDNIEKILDNVSENYRSGNKDTAFSLATNAYLENYEYVEGAIAQKDRPLMEKVELMLRVDLRSMIKNGDAPDNIDAKIDSIKNQLSIAKSLFQ
ncbi:MAG: hypothetical protein PVG43_03915 [Nitrosopumilaceae archaeon]